MKLKLVGTGAIGAFERSASSLVDDIILVDCGNGITKTVVQEGGKIEEAIEYFKKVNGVLQVNRDSMMQLH